MKLHNPVFLFLLVATFISSCKKDDSSPASATTDNTKTILEVYFKGTVDDVPFDFSNKSNGYEFEPVKGMAEGPTEESYYATYGAAVKKSSNPGFLITYTYPLIDDGDDRDDIETMFSTGTFSLGKDDPGFIVSYFDGTNYFESRGVDNSKLEITEVKDLGVINIRYFDYYDDKTKAIRITGTMDGVKVHNDTEGDKILNDVTFSVVFTTLYDEE